MGINYIRFIRERDGFIIIVKRRENRMLRLLFHLFMTGITGGLWLIVLLVRFLIQ